VIKIDCEICGRTSENRTAIHVSGVEFRVCNNCLNLGPVVRQAAASAAGTIKKQNSVVETNIAPIVHSEEEFLIDNYGEMVRQAREILKLKQSDVARRINEKESVIHGVETGKHTPDFKLARKFETFYGVKLVRKESEL